MESKIYLAIDKSLIIEGMKLNFSIFVHSSNEEIICLKENGSSLTSDDIVIIDSAKILYIDESEHSDYKNFLNTREEIENIKLSHKPSIIYEKASYIIKDLFNNPEKLACYESSKEIVNYFLETILDDDFKIKSLMDVATFDYYEHTHSINVSIYSLCFGAYLELHPDTLHELGEAALLFDIGKSKIDTTILNKKSSLTQREFQEIKKHPDLGYTICMNLGIDNKNILQGIRYHHEKIDGTGYPSGLKGNDIPLFARIIGMFDVFDALTSRRTYKDAMSTFEAIKFMKLKMNNHIDIKLLNKMIEMFRN